jgi:hypothetical protein
MGTFLTSFDNGQRRALTFTLSDRQTTGFASHAGYGVQLRQKVELRWPEESSWASRDRSQPKNLLP